ncbi:hypothetical protein [Paraburkholderia sp. BL25I1N1]|uniref:hypothetical protein n=1 Tax=Paraburkholderia sp. BL25I1N1 TaxID=1938804 RepID=UPI000D0649CF|nr:hypothetical protein [Paraburkholderia sp. BL25I1N1]PRY03789.1 hypothetical protein B0G73_114110 [Paraburkholderia sp. BL25I1N1]
MSTVISVPASVELSPRALSASMATYIAYSEWRPTRWRLSLSTGQKYGLFTSHEKASKFADGALMHFDEGDPVEATITCVRQAAYFTWQGDNIGCDEGAAVIHFNDQFGILRSLGVAETLRRAEHIDGYGLTRVVLALRACVDQLHPGDLTAWLEHEAEYPIRTGGELL